MKQNKSFIESSSPPEAEPTAREMYLAANPAAARLQTAHLSEFRNKLGELLDGLNPMLRQFVNKAECARQIGIILLELVDTLPGKRLTQDFYEQMRAEFVDAQGRVLPLELLEWFMKCARSNAASIEDMGTALRWNQTLLLASDDASFRLEPDPMPKHRLTHLDELGRLKSWFEKSDVVQTWQALKQNPRYFPDGHLRPDLREIMAEEFKPQLAVMDEMKRELGL